MVDKILRAGPIRTTSIRTENVNRSAKPIKTSGVKPRSNVVTTKDIITSGKTKLAPEKPDKEPEETNDPNPVEPNKPIELKPWEEFVINAYLENGGNKTAAFRVGKPQSAKWTEKTINEKASRFFSIGKVRARLSELQEAVREATQITAVRITELNMQIVERCMQHEPVRHKNGELVYVEDEHGALVPAYTFQAIAALKGLDQLAKHIGYYEKDTSRLNQGPSIEVVFVEPNATNQG